jgi:hypothetical protein
MNDDSIVKITAIVSLVLLEIINLLTLKLDGNVLLTIGAIIGGIAGYEIRPVIEKRREKRKE